MPSTPTTGVCFTTEEIEGILASAELPQDLSSYTCTDLGYNNRVYIISTMCGSEVVLKAGGRHWKRQKTEAEVAGLPALTYRRKLIAMGVDPARKTAGKTMKDAWGTLSDAHKEDVARSLGNLVVRMQQKTPTMLGLGDVQPQYGNPSLTRPEDDATGHDHVSVTVSPSSSQPLYVSHVLNGPPPSMTYLAYVHALYLSAVALLEHPSNLTRFTYQPNVERLSRLRLFAERLWSDPPQVLVAINANPHWRPVFTHGDLQPQNILIHTDNTVSVPDWEWGGFFPPHTEGEAVLNVLVALLNPSQACRPKEVFLEVLHKADIMSPWSASAAEWEAAMKLTRLTECVVPWWLDGFPFNGDETEEDRKELAEKRDAVALEIDELLEFFGS